MKQADLGLRWGLRTPAPGAWEGERVEVWQRQRGQLGQGVWMTQGFYSGSRWS